MGKYTRGVGNIGEMIASNYLESKGYKVVSRNYLRKWGEIDLICEKAGTIRFVEVKAVSVEDFSRERPYEPEDLVDQRKLKKLARTASLYMEEKGDGREFQIDVVGVLLHMQTKVARCRLFEQVLG